MDISRIAKNMPIQGTAAELAKLAMTRVHERLTLELKDAYLVNMIHDELVVECKLSDREAASQIVKEEMLGAQEAFFDNVRPEVEVFWR
jgi:DNA polymerase-1